MFYLRKMYFITHLFLKRYNSLYQSRVRGLAPFALAGSFCPLKERNRFNLIPVCFQSYIRLRRAIAIVVFHINLLIFGVKKVVDFSLSPTLK